MAKTDLEGVLALENENPSAWSASQLTSELEVANGLQFVVESAGWQIVGWCACRVVPPEAELLKIAVKESARRSGVGGLLFYRLLDGLVEREIDSLFLEVRTGNQAAVSFYKKKGFQHVGTRPKYYQDPPESGLILQLSLS